MAENELAPKALGKKTVVTIIGAIATATVFAVCGWIYGTYTTSRLESGLTGTLKQFESDINSNSFEAHRYFGSFVSHFWDEENITSREINVYWKGKFEKRFKDYKLTFDYNSLQVEKGDKEHSAIIYLSSDYFLVPGNKLVNGERSRYDLKFDDEFKIVSILQTIEK